MANKRDYKKYVEALSAAMIDEMIAAYYNVKGADQDKIAKAMETVMGAMAKARNNSNVYFSRGASGFADMKEYAKAKKPSSVRSSTRSIQSLKRRQMPLSSSSTRLFPQRRKPATRNMQKPQWQNKI